MNRDHSRTLNLGGNVRNLILALVGILALAGHSLAADIPAGVRYSEITYNTTPEGLAFHSIVVLRPITGGDGKTEEVGYTWIGGPGPKLYVEGKAVTATELAAWSFARVGTTVYICENRNLYFAGGRLWQTNTAAPPTCPNGNCPRR